MEAKDVIQFLVEQEKALSAAIRESQMEANMSVIVIASSSGFHCRVCRFDANGESTGHSGLHETIAEGVVQAFANLVGIDEQELPVPSIQAVEAAQAKFERTKKKRNRDHATHEAIDEVIDENAAR